MRLFLQETLQERTEHNLAGGKKNLSDEQSMIIHVSSAHCPYPVIRIASGQGIVAGEEKIFSV